MKILFVLMFIFLNCSTIKNKDADICTQFDSITKKYVCTFVSQMPLYKSGDNEFLTDFSKLYKFKFKEDDLIQTKLKLQFIIDKEGKIIGERIIDKNKDEYTEFEKAGLKTLKKLNYWKAGTENGKKVNVLLSKIINIKS